MVSRMVSCGRLEIGLLLISRKFRQADCQSAAGFQPAPQYSVLLRRSRAVPALERQPERELQAALRTRLGARDPAKITIATQRTRVGHALVRKIKDRSVGKIKG